MNCRSVFVSCLVHERSMQELILGGARSASIAEDVEARSAAASLTIGTQNSSIDTKASFAAGPLGTRPSKEGAY